MSQYSSDMAPGMGVYDGETKTSIAAVLGFIVSLIGCCLPTGLLGAVLGVFGLIGIGRSGGRVGGKGLAIAAIIIGVLSTIVQIGAVVATLAWARQVYPFGVTAGEFLSHVENSEYDQARAILSGPMASVDDATLAAFGKDVQDDVGKFVSTPDSLGSLWSGWMELGKVLSENQVPMSVPIALQFEDGRAMVQYVFDPQAGSKGLPAMTDIQVTTANGDAYRLSDYARGLTPNVNTPAPSTGDDTTGADEPAEPEEPADDGG